MDERDPGGRVRVLPTAARPITPLGPRPENLVDRRTVLVSVLAIVIALVAGLAAQVLTRLIWAVTHLAFFGRLATSAVSPADNHLGPAVILVPVVGGAIVGLMARYGSPAIRGHGIPEAMEQILTNGSRIPPRLTWLKPLSAAVSIGTGGPFGAEGPIIATGSAFGSLVGQLLHTTATERKTLLAAGAAAGMAATFGSPVSAVLLAVELLLFEFRARSLIPVALASATAAGAHLAFTGGAPVFAMPDVASPGGMALIFYVALGAVVGVASVGVTKAVYWVEELFERLPLPWVVWPAIGGVAVGLIGMVEPRTLGVGYENIEQALRGTWPAQVVLTLCILKFVSWAVSLGSGTSGGTLAPLFTLGGGLGAVLGMIAAAVLPSFGIDPRVAALVGMAAMFAGAARALLASVVFAFETTRQPLGLLPLLGGCAAAYLISSLLMRHSIMTEKIARRGIRILHEYTTDFLDGVHVRDCASIPPVCLVASRTVAETRAWMASGRPDSAHQGFPVVTEGGSLLGVLTRRDLLEPALDPTAYLAELVQRPPLVAFTDSSLREAADHMLRAGVGRLPVVERAHPTRVVGFLTRSDVLAAHRTRLHEATHAERSIPRLEVDPIEAEATDA